MAKVTPDQVFKDIQYENNAVIIPIETLPGLTPEEADPISGDIRSLMMSILDQLFSVLIRLDSESQPTDFSVSKSNPVGVSTNKVRETLSINMAYFYQRTSTSFEPEPEPDELT